MKDVLSLIKESFHYLIHEYKFLIDREQYSPEVMGNASVVYKAANIGIQVVVDRSQVLLNIGESVLPDRYWFDFSDVMQYFAPHIKSIYGFQNNDSRECPNIGGQLKELAVMLRQYCEPILRGDFSMSKGIREIETKRISEMLDEFRTYSQRHSSSES